MREVLAFDRFIYSAGSAFGFSLASVFDRKSVLYLNRDSQFDIVRRKLSSSRQPALVWGNNILPYCREIWPSCTGVALLRDPALRFISMYYMFREFALFNQDRFWECRLAADHPSLDTFVRRYTEKRSTFLRSQASDLLCLFDYKVAERGEHNPFYHDAYDPLGQNQQPEAIYEKARKNFPFVYIVELMEESVWAFCRHFNRPFATAKAWKRHRHWHFRPWDEYDIPPETMARVEELVHPEAELYALFRQDFEEAFAPYAGEEGYLDYKASCIAKDRKMLRHYLSGDTRYLPRSVVDDSAIADRLRAKVIARIQDRLYPVPDRTYDEDILSLVSRTNRDTPFMIWGTGGRYQEDYRDKLLSERPPAFLGFIDGNAGPDNGELDGFPVHSPDALDALRPTSVIVAAARSIRDMIEDRVTTMNLSHSPKLYWVPRAFRKTFGNSEN